MLYQTLGAAKDEALARRALELAFGTEPGPTVSPAIISAVSGEHAKLTLEYVLARLEELEPLVDLSSRSRFIARLAQSGNDPALVGMLEAYAKANVAEADRRPIDEALAKMRARAAAAPRIAAESTAWLKQTAR